MKNNHKLTEKLKVQYEEQFSPLNYLRISCEGDAFKYFSVLFPICKDIFLHHHNIGITIRI